MLQLIRELFNLLTPAQRRRFYILQVLVIFMALAEIAGVASIGPFMMLVADTSVLEGAGRMAKLYHMSGLEKPGDFVFWSGIITLAILTFSSCISAFTTWQLALFSNRIGAELGNRLYNYYMHQPWLFHTNHSSPQLIRNTSGETARITVKLLAPLMQMNARIVLALFLSTSIFLFNPVVAISGLLIFGLAYLLLFSLVRHRLTKHGERISEQQGHRIRLMTEGFGGIKDVLLLNRQKMFVEHFQSTNNSLAHSQSLNQTLAQAPRYLMELMAFGSMIFLVLYLLYLHDGNMAAILPSLAVYALAGFKLMPAFQSIYQQVASIRGGLPAYLTIEKDLKASQYLPVNDFPSSDHTIQIKQSITLNSIYFTYPGKPSPALNGLSLNIPANSIVGIVGPSGSGKTTLIDILLGLIPPDSGNVLLDNHRLDDNNRPTWQNTIGFVAQNIFLSNATLAENIAFGVPLSQIDNDKLKAAAHLAHLDKVIDDLPEGLNTRVGERGVRLSGGQRQRIGIARALYHDASVLILDEATSSLDGITEKMIMDAIHDFSRKKTIIMIAHRLKTVQACDTIYFIKDGKLANQGRYDELLVRDAEFARMALHA